MPSQAALERGSAVARDILEAHREANNGTWPETVAVRISLSQTTSLGSSTNRIRLRASRSLSLLSNLCSWSFERYLLAAVQIVY